MQIISLQRNIRQELMISLKKKKVITSEKIHSFKP